MKTSILTLFIVLSSIALKAQYGQKPEIRAKEKAESLHQSLQFTPQQSEKITQIYLNHFRYRDSMITVINKRHTNQQARNAAFTSMFNKRELDTDKEINSVLNSDQRVRYAKYISSRGAGYMESIRSPSPRR